MDTKKRVRTSEARRFEEEEGEEDHREGDETLRAVQATEEEETDDEQASFYEGERVEKDNLVIGESNDIERGDDPVDRVGRYPCSLNSPSDDGSLGGKAILGGEVIQGRVVKHFGKKARRYGGD